LAYNARRLYAPLRATFGEDELEAQNAFLRRCARPATGATRRRASSSPGSACCPGPGG
jgi:hypothetical protein